MSKSSVSGGADIGAGDITRQAELVVMEYLKASKCSKTLDTMLSAGSWPASITASDLYAEDLQSKKKTGASSVLDYMVRHMASEPASPLDSTMSSHSKSRRRSSSETTAPSVEDKATVEWSKDEVSLLKKAIKQTSGVDDKNERWKQIAALVGNGKTKKHCYLKYKELKEEKKASSGSSDERSSRRSSSSDEKSSHRRSSSRSRSSDREDAPPTTKLPSPASEAKECSLTSEPMMKRVDFSATKEQRNSSARQEVIEMEDCEDLETLVVPISRTSGITRPQLFSNEKATASGRSPTAEEIESLQGILFPEGKKGFSSHWDRQGFFFSEVRNLRYGLVQHEGGPCGVLAVVQAYTLRFLLKSVCPRDWRNPTETEQHQALIQALVHMLWQVARTSRRGQCTVVLNDDRTGAGPQSKRRFMSGTQLFTVKTPEQLHQVLTQYLRQFTAPKGNGLVLFVASVLLSKGVENIKPEMDTMEGALGGSSKLIGGHDYCTQEMVNLLLCGVACSNVFDGKQLLEGTSEDDPKAIVLKGIPSRCDVGFLSLFEAYEYIHVGSHLKNPVFNVWVVCSESHYSVLFADPSATAGIDSMRTIDMFYFDGLANQDEEIQLTVHTSALRDKPKPQSHQLIPPLNLVLQTKWPLARIDWNNTEPLL